MQITYDIQRSDVFFYFYLRDIALSKHLLCFKKYKRLLVAPGATLMSAQQACMTSAPPL
jgi:hypothetical protein